MLTEDPSDAEVVDSRSDLAGRTFLVTGATSGIGRATTLALGRRGGRLLLACRDEAAALDLAGQVDALPGPATAATFPLDLADLDSVRACAAIVLAQDESIHVLVNNAGVAGKKGVTAQGFELTFGVNHLGHFLLTTLLLDRMQESAPARVVTVASSAHYGAKGLDFDALQLPTRSLGGLREYQASKFCNVLFNQELARRLGGDGGDGAAGQPHRAAVTALAVHPGVVASNIWRQVPWPIRPIAKRFMISNDEGAIGSLHCATAPDLERFNGAYFDRDHLADASTVATPALGAELWAHSEKWVET